MNIIDAVGVPAQGRAALLAKRSESFRRHRLAFEEILRLTLARTLARLAASSLVQL